ncbi:MAG: hypothetical protein RDV48_12870 [Candidatus Eremiobacteraeota bacterium]|nr:hypothetical protein [Candidatus Eremiobacteraeota bacterium]
MKSFTAALALFLSLLSAGAYGEELRTVKTAKLDLKYYRSSPGESPAKGELHVQGDSHVLVATVTNTSGRTIAFISHYEFIPQHGWKLKITGPGGDYATPPPPGVVMPLRPEHCIVLKPGKSYSKRYAVSSALCYSGNRSSHSSLGATAGSYTASISYTFSPSMISAARGPAPQGATGSGEEWQKLFKEACFVEAMASPAVRFTVEKPR